MDKKSSFYIVGKHAVVEALKNPSRKVLKIFLTEDSKKFIHKTNPRKNLLNDIKIFYKTKKEMDKYVGNIDILHQGYIAEINHLDKLSLREYITNNSNIKLACLNEVTDPRNIGSIIRSAASFELDGIIVKDRHFPSESKLLFKSASGCMEHINIFKVSNINSTLKYLREKQFWIYGFENKGDKIFSAKNIENNCVFVFGSEGYGLKEHTKKYIDFLCRINMSKKIESLNISNCASIVFQNIYNNKNEI